MAEQLLADGWRVRIFERPGIAVPRQLAQARELDWMTGDFQSSSGLARALDGVDAVVHLIATLLPKNSNEAPLQDVQTGRAFDVPVSILDNSRARSELRWTPAISLAEGLRMTAAAIVR